MISLPCELLKSTFCVLPIRRIGFIWDFAIRRSHWQTTKDVEGTHKEQSHPPHGCLHHSQRVTATSRYTRKCPSCHPGLNDCRSFSSLTTKDYRLLNPGTLGDILINEELLGNSLPLQTISSDLLPSLKTYHRTFLGPWNYEHDRSSVISSQML